MSLLTIITISAVLSILSSVLMGKSESYRLVIRILAAGCVIAGGVHYFTQDYLWSLTAFGVSLVVLGCAVWLKLYKDLQRPAQARSVLGDLNPNPPR